VGVGSNDKSPLGVERDRNRLGVRGAQSGGGAQHDEALAVGDDRVGGAGGTRVAELEAPAEGVGDWGRTPGGTGQRSPLRAAKLARFPVSLDGPKGSPFGTRCLRATALYRCLVAGIDEFVSGQPSNDGELCQGDSGGPLTRTVTSNGMPQVVIVGVNSAIFPGGKGGGANADQTCAFQGNDTSQWSRVDASYQFIVSTMQSWQNGPNFMPTLLPDGSDPQRFAQLWGPICQNNCQCGANSYCENPVSDPNGMYQTSPDANPCFWCQGFPGATGGCSCISGQCLPLSPGDSSDSGSSDSGLECDGI